MILQGFGALRFFWRGLCGAKWLSDVNPPASSPMLSGPQKTFCDGIVRGLNQTEAYQRAYPKASPDAARKHAPRLVAKGDIKAEIERMRQKAEEKAGSAVLTLAEKRMKLAEITRSNSEETRDKLSAIKIDNDLSGDGAEAEGNKALAGLAGLVERLRR